MKAYSPPNTRITLKQCLDYEIHSHWLAKHLDYRWSQNLFAKYIAWKAQRKYRSYNISRDIADKVERWHKHYSNN